MRLFAPLRFVCVLPVVGFAQKSKAENLIDSVYNIKTTSCFYFVLFTTAHRWATHVYGGIYFEYLANQIAASVIER